MMKPPVIHAVRTVALLIVVSAGAAGAGSGDATVVKFDRARLGQAPPGFRLLSSSRTQPGLWQIERAERTLVLGQTTIGEEGYRLAVLEGTVLGDVHAGARLRVGRGDRAAGIAWRVQDAGNYYAARLDFDRREVVLYKFVHGTRVRLARSTDVRLDPEQWHELAADHRKDRARVWLNGVPVLSARDESLTRSGMVGFWMPGDGTAQFERLWFAALGGTQ